MSWREKSKLKMHNKTLVRTFTTLRFIHAAQLGRYITMKYSLILLLIFTHSPLCYAQIYQCIDGRGKIIFKDSECDLEEKLIKSIATPEIHEIERTPNNTFIKDDKPGILIFRDDGDLSPPYKIKVHEVRVITETEDRLVVDVIYTYEHEIPVEEIKIFILPNHGYWATADIKASRGKNVGRASIGLSRSNMNKDNATRSFTDTLRVGFEHYPPKKYNGVIWSEIVKYEKNWTLKQ